MGVSQNLKPNYMTVIYSQYLTTVVEMSIARKFVPLDISKGSQGLMKNWKCKVS
jgi:hypothetical protein